MNDKFFSIESSWISLLNTIKEIAEKSDLTYKGEDESVFLREIGVLDDNYDLSKKGKEFYDAFYIFNDENEALLIITELLKDHKPTQVLCEILWGYQNLTKSNIYRLLLTNDIISKSVKEEDLTGFIMILNKCKFLVYNKKTGKIKILYNPKVESSEKPRSRIISPDLHYSNILALRKIIRSGNEYIWWFDKHFSNKGLEPLAEELNRNNVKELKILMSFLTTTDLQKFHGEFKRLSKEMNEKDIISECRVLLDKDLVHKIHGRWLISNSYCYNLPPINTIYQGQFDELKLTENKPPFEDWWNKSFDILKDWNKVFVEWKGHHNKTED